MIFRVQRSRGCLRVQRDWGSPGGRAGGRPCGRTRGSTRGRPGPKRGTGLEAQTATVARGLWKKCGNKIREIRRKGWKRKLQKLAKWKLHPFLSLLLHQKSNLLLWSGNRQEKTFKRFIPLYLPKPWLGKEIERKAFFLLLSSHKSSYINTVFWNDTIIIHI